MKPPLIAIDTETGGLFPSLHPLLSVSIVPEWTMKPYTVYVEPMPLDLIDCEAVKTNGYTHEKWLDRGALPVPLAMRLVKDQLAKLKKERPDAVLVAHNAGFDQSFIQESERYCDIAHEHRYHWRCSLQLMAQLMDLGLIPRGSLSLARLGELSGLWPVGGRPVIHEAHEDAIACLKGYQWLQQRLANALTQSSTMTL